MGDKSQLMGLVSFFSAECLYTNCSKSAVSAYGSHEIVVIQYMYMWTLREISTTDGRQLLHFIGMCTVIFMTKGYSSPCGEWEPAQIAAAMEANALRIVSISSSVNLYRLWTIICLINRRSALSQDDSFGLRGGHSRGPGKCCDPRPLHLFLNTSMRNSLTVIA